MPQSGQGIRLALIVTPSFNLAATMGFLDPFRAANYLEGSGQFIWRFYSEAGGRCMASNGIAIDTAPLVDLPQAPPPDLLLLSSSWTPESFGTPALHAVLRSAARAGRSIAAIDTGAFILAQAGLLKGRRATVHYEHIDAFQELFPDCEVTEALFEFDGHLLTCCGGVASSDFALHILRGLAGERRANGAARYIYHPHLREPGSPQNPQGPEPLGTNAPPPVRRAIKAMEGHLEDPLSIEAIAAEAQVSHRQLNRLFAQYLKKTPRAYYRDIRLDRARGLVTQTGLSMAEISVASGFASQVHFSRAYKARFGLPPIKDRIEGRIPFEFRAWPMYRKNSGEKSSKTGA